MTTAPAAEPMASADAPTRPRTSLRMQHLRNLGAPLLHSANRAMRIRFVNRDCSDGLFGKAENPNLGQSASTDRQSGPGRLIIPAFQTGGVGAPRAADREKRPQRRRREVRSFEATTMAGHATGQRTQAGGCRGGARARRRRRRQTKKKGGSARAALIIDQVFAYATCARTGVRRRRIAKPTAPKPRSIIAQVAGSGNGA